MYTFQKKSGKALIFDFVLDIADVNLLYRNLTKLVRIVHVIVLINKTGRRDVLFFCVENCKE